jgi:undecaprenyl-diphosphatase
MSAARSVVATIPAGVIALALQKTLTRMTAKPQAAALFLIVNGLILLGAESMRRRARARARERARAAAGRAVGDRVLESLGLREALSIGIAQSAALIAGISRDGVTMSAGLARRLDHEAAARFAFLLATPIILAAGIYKLPTLAGSAGAGIRGQALLACLAAAITAYFVVAFLVRWFRVRTLAPFALYCILFGAAMSIYTAS